MTVGPTSGNSATTWPVGWVEPLPGSTVNFSALELPRSDSPAVVDGATALSSMVPAEISPLSLTNHIWYTVPGLGFGTSFITSTPAFLSREKTTVAVPPPGMSPEMVCTSGAANTCWAVEGCAGLGHNDTPTPTAPNPITAAAAAVSSVVLRRRPDSGRAVGSVRTLSPATCDNSRWRSSAGGSAAPADDTSAIVSRTARTSS